MQNWSTLDAAAATYTRTDPEFEDADHAIRVFLSKSSGGANILAIEGTHDPLGWALDFIALDVEDQQGMNHATLGLIHAGFYGSALAALTRCALIAARGPYAICGHSLGAATALLIGALLMDDMLPPVKIGAFAPPRVGGDVFIKTATSVPGCYDRYGTDPVTDVPIWLPPRFAYKQVPLRQFNAPLIPAWDIRARLAQHHIENYVSAVHAIDSKS